MAYTKNTWNTGDIVSSQKLNHMEDGIANSENVFIVGGELTYNQEEDTFIGTLDKTWKEIHDALQTRICIAVIVNGNDIRKAMVYEAVYDQEEGKFAIRFAMVDSTFFAETENDYPTTVGLPG